MRNLIFITLIFILGFNLDLAGQNNYQKGFIITNSEDTIQGFVNYENWTVSPKIILFKENIDVKAKKYEPALIKGFYVAKEYFSSANVIIDKSQDNLINEDTVNIFVRLLVKGKLNLLVYKSQYKDYYIIQTDTSFNELIHKKYSIKNDNDSIFRYENNKYIGQLKFYMADYLEIDKALKEIEYTSTSLSKLFLKYNNKTDAKSEDLYKYGYKALVFVPSINVGLFHSVYSFPTKPTNTGFTFGVGSFIMQNYFLPNQKIYIGILYQHINYKYEYITVSKEYTNLTYNNYINVDEHHIIAEASYRFQPTLKKFQPYFELINVLGLYKTGTNSYIQERHFYNQVSTTEDEVNTIPVGVGIGLGLSINHYSTGLRYLLVSGGKTIMFNVVYSFKSISEKN